MKELAVNGHNIATEAVNHGASPITASKLMNHEWNHASGDTEGAGRFGLLLAPALISYFEQVQDTWVKVTKTIEVVVGAFYQVIGTRSAEMMVKIASAVGFANMSDQDWSVYNHFTDLINQKQNSPQSGEVEINNRQSGTIWQPSPDLKTSIIEH